MLVNSNYGRHCLASRPHVVSSSPQGSSSHTARWKCGWVSVLHAISQQNLPQIKTHGYSKSERDRSYRFHQCDHRFCLGKHNSSLVCLFSRKIPLKSCGQKVCGEGMLNYRQAFGQERAHMEGMCCPSFISDCAALAANHFKGVSLY